MTGMAGPQQVRVRADSDVNSPASSMYHGMVPERCFGVEPCGGQGVVREAGLARGPRETRAPCPEVLASIVKGGIVDHRENVHRLLRELELEILAFVRERESARRDGWVPATEINDELGLRFPAVPKTGKQYG